MDDLEHYMEATGRLSRKVTELESQLSASEAIFGFCGWLTSRDERTIMSASDDAPIIADLIQLFCDTNKLIEPRDGWENKFTHPPKAVLNI